VIDLIMTAKSPIVGGLLSVLQMPAPRCFARDDTVARPQQDGPRTLFVISKRYSLRGCSWLSLSRWRAAAAGPYGAFRTWTVAKWLAWKACWICTLKGQIPNGRSYASMKARPSWLARCSSRSLLPLDSPVAMMTSTVANGSMNLFAMLGRVDGF